jgi:hypothetical protein
VQQRRFPLENGKTFQTCAQTIRKIKESQQSVHQKYFCYVSYKPKHIIRTFKKKKIDLEQKQDGCRFFN